MLRCREFETRSKIDEKEGQKRRSRRKIKGKKGVYRECNVCVYMCVSMCVRVCVCLMYRNWCDGGYSRVICLDTVTLTLTRVIPSIC